jgi:hypothetical protein
MALSCDNPTPPEERRCGDHMRPVIGAAIRKYIDAGFDHIVLTQIGPDQECLRLFENELARRCARRTRP